VTADGRQSTSSSGQRPKDRRGDRHGDTAGNRGVGLVVTTYKTTRVSVGEFDNFVVAQVA
jgi:hypothetical protein